MEITYHTDRIPDAPQIAALFRSSGIRRPVDDLPRIEQMFAHANLVISAWAGDELIGIARSLTDFCYCCYLSDLAVRKEYQRAGVGRRLIALTQEQIGPRTALILLSAPAAMAYYPRVGFEKTDNAYIIKRSE